MKTTQIKINDKHILLEKTKIGRRIAIGDVHGCCKTLKKLMLEQIKPTLDDQIIFLGDYLHRGDDSAGVMDFIIDLRAKGYEIFTLSGNHEQMALEKDAMARRKYGNMTEEEKENKAENDEHLPRLIKNNNFSDKFRIIYPKYRAFLDTLVYCYQMEDFVFVHAGINFEAEKPFEDFESMIWERDLDFIPTSANFRIIHGHTPIFLSEIETQIKNKAKVINLDNGCYYGINPNNLRVTTGYYGNLCALDLDNWILYTEKCLDLGSYDF